jgi:hypothetical protein
MGYLSRHTHARQEPKMTQTAKTEQPLNAVPATRALIADLLAGLRGVLSALMVPLVLLLALALGIATTLH